jgi:hypothetical protein
MSFALVIAAALIAHALGLATWATRVVLPSVLVFIVPPLLAVTGTRDPLAIAALVAFVLWIGKIMRSDVDPRLAAATAFSAALFIDAAALFACGHPVVAAELAVMAPFVRRLVLAHAFA